MFDQTPAPWMPNLYLIGAPKCATTTLAETLASHPSLYVGARKEHHVFSNRKFHRSGRWAFRRQYRRGITSQYRFDGSTSYCMLGCYPGTAARIHQACPQARIIFALRDPLPRLISHFREELIWRRVPPDIESALDVNPELLDAGRYMRTLLEYQNTFGQSQVLTVLAEDLAAQPDRVLADIFDFLELDSPAARSPIRRNSTLDKGAHGALKASLMRVPGVMQAGQLLPPTVRDLINRRLESPVPKNVELSAAVLARLKRDFLESEWRACLRTLGRDDAVWPSLAQLSDE